MSESRIIACVAVVLGLTGLVSLAVAQSGSRSSRSGTQRTQGSAARADSPFEERFWNYLQQAQYKNWAPLSGVSADAYDGNSPHGDKVKLYANRTAVAGASEFPPNSILVKENFDASGNTLMAVTVMYRVKGYNPDAGDWHWTKYEPAGAVSEMDGMRVTGKVEMCIECHRSAGGEDFVFANDQ